jgi:ABC-type sulfate transport system permease component
MLLWLIGVAVFVLLWGALWRANPKAAYGVVWGFLLALILSLIFSRQFKNYVTGMNEIPIWLPPIPIILVVIALFYFGIKTWLNADNLPPPRERESHDGQHDHGHGHH